MSHEAPGDPALDDDFRSLFRPDTPAHVEELAEVDVAVEEPRVATATSAGTGRLFRSAGASESETAILALRPEQARKLRSTQQPAAWWCPRHCSQGAAPAAVAVLLAAGLKQQLRQAPA